MLSINSNLSSLVAQQSMSSATNKLNQAIERMTTGYKINGAKDNAANYSISNNMQTQLGSYDVAADNVAMGMDLVTTASDIINSMQDKATRLQALCTQARNGTYGQQSLTAINSEANALVDEINRIYSTAEYNGKKLFTGNDTNATPAAATYGARTASTNTTYTDEEVAAMTSISDVSSFTDGECYSISTAEELARLAELTNSGVDTTGATFVLANDIDLKEWCEAHSADGGWTLIGNYDSYTFDGSFDGNGHVISNLTINRPTENYQGLFGSIGDEMVQANVTIKNLGLENVNIKGGSCTGGLVGAAFIDTIENCYVTGTVVGNDHVGGLVGNNIASVTNSHVNVNVTGRENVGGLVGETENDIINCFSMGNVNGSESVGGLFGFGDGGTIENCFALGAVTGGNESGFAGGAPGCNDIINCLSVQEDQSGWGVEHKTKEEILMSTNLESMGFTEDNGWTIVNGQPVLAFSMAARNANAGGLGGSNYVTLQVGINADSYSQIGLEFGFALDGIEGLRQIGLDTSTDYLSTLDNMLDIVSAKATEYGAVQNRLESALDEIAIQYDNLVSSRSTLRDADIAEVSSQYIQQQILQQASATLLATANQSPSIALQLI